MGELIVNWPNIPMDQEVEVFPYGMFKNGHKYQVEGLVDPNTGEVLDRLVLGEINAKPPVVNAPPSTPVKSEDTDAEAPGAKEEGE